MEGDLGTTRVDADVGGQCCSSPAAPMRLFGWMAGAIGALIALLSITTPYRLQRFATWLDPASDPSGTGWQVLHGQYALATGGWWALGSVPAARRGLPSGSQTDFILAVIGEEVGLVGTLSVLALFAIIASSSPRSQCGLTMSLCAWQRRVSVFGSWRRHSSTLALLLERFPSRGLPLPLVSYGGSSLTFTLMAVGMLLAFCPASAEARALLETRKAGRKSGGRRAQKRMARERREREAYSVTQSSGASQAGDGDSQRSEDGRRRRATKPRRPRVSRPDAERRSPRTSNGWRPLANVLLAGGELPDISSQP